MRPKTGNLGCSLIKIGWGSILTQVPSGNDLAEHTPAMILLDGSVPLIDLGRGGEGFMTI